MAGSSRFQAIVNIAKLTIGNGILALPYATLRGGLLFSPIFIALIALWNVICCLKMIKCKYITTNRIYPTGIVTSYSKISYSAFGICGALITDICVFITLFGVCISYQIAFTQFLKDISSNPFYTWSDSAQSLCYTLFSILIVFPLICQKDIGFLSKTSLIGLFCLLISLGVLIYYGISIFQSNINQISNSTNKLTLWPTTISSFTTFNGVAIFCFGLCTFTFPIEESMTNRDQFPSAVFLSTLFVTIFYAIIGDSLAFIYSHNEEGVDQNILRNLPISSVAAELVRISLALVCLVSIPLALVPSSQIIEQWSSIFFFSHTSISKNIQFSNISINNENQQLLPPTMEGNSHNNYNSYNNINNNDDNNNDEENNFEKINNLNINRFKYICRFFLLISCSILANLIPCFELVISLLGSLTVCFLSFVLPSLLHLVLVVNPQLYSSTLSQEKSNLRFAWYIDVLMTCCGCFVCIFATSTTILEAYNHFQTLGHC